MIRRNLEDQTGSDSAVLTKNALVPRKTYLLMQVCRTPFGFHILLHPQGSFTGQKKMSIEVFVKVRRHYNVYYIQASI